MIILLLFVVPPQDPAEWVKKLTAGPNHERWRAVEALASMGARGKKALDRCPDPWWKAIAAAEIESAVEAEGKQHRPLRVTLRPGTVSAAAVIRSLAEQTKVQVDLTSPPDGKLNVSRAEGTYFETLIEVGRQAEVDIVRTSESAYEIVPDSVAGRFSWAAGPFLVRAKKIVESTHVTFEKAPYSALTLECFLRPQPGMTVLSTESARLVLARDDTGRELTGTGTTTSRRRVYSSNRRSDRDACEFRMNLGRPAGKAKRISLLRGSLRVVLPLEEKTVRFTDVKPGREETKKVGPITVHLKEFREDRDTFRVLLEVRVADGLKHWPDRGDFILSDDSGNVYQSWGSSTSRGEKEGRYNLTFRNTEGAGPPKKLTGRFVTRTYGRTVFFQLEDLPLP